MIFVLYVIHIEVIKWQSFVKNVLKEGFIPKTYRFYPHLIEGEGQFLAILRKKAQEEKILVDDHILANIANKIDLSLSSKSLKLFGNAVKGIENAVNVKRNSDSGGIAKQSSRCGAVESEEGSLTPLGGRGIEDRARGVRHTKHNDRSRKFRKCFKSHHGQRI